MSRQQLLHSLEGKVANISKDQAKQSDICESLHVLGEAALLLFWGEFCPIHCHTFLIDFDHSEEDTLCDENANSSEPSNHREQLPESLRVGIDILISLVDKKLTDNLFSLSVQSKSSSSERYKLFLNLFVGEDARGRAVLVAGECLGLGKAFSGWLAGLSASHLNVLLLFIVGLLEFVFVAFVDILNLSHVWVVFKFVVGALCDDFTLVHNDNLVS